MFYVFIQTINYEQRMLVPNCVFGLLFFLKRFSNSEGQSIFCWIFHAISSLFIRKQFSAHKNVTAGYAGLKKVCSMPGITHAQASPVLTQTSESKWECTVSVWCETKNTLSQQCKQQQFRLLFFSSLWYYDSLIGSYPANWAGKRTTKMLDMLCEKHCSLNVLGVF